MNETVQEHPSDEMLIEYALGDSREQLRDHIHHCPSCSRFVRELTVVREAFTDIEQESVESQVKDSIFRNTRKTSLENTISHFIRYWYKYPFLIGIMTVFAVLFFYFLFLLAQV